MTEPRRLLHRAPSADVRRALLADVEMAPPSAAEERVWTALSTAIATAGGSVGVAAAMATAAKPASGAVVASASATTASGFGAVAVAKLIAIGVGTGALALGGHGVWTSMAARPAARASEPATQPAAFRSEHGSPAPSLPLPLPELPSAVPAPELPTPSSTVIAPPALRSSAPSPPIAPAARARRPDESSVVLEAREALRRGDASEALAILRRAQSDVAGGGLEQERGALEIEALARLGSRDEASRLAADFVQRYPDSPYAAGIRSLIR